jgi:replication factor C subunit 2/4
MTTFMDSETFERKRSEQLPLNEKYAPKKISDLMLPPLLKTKIVNFVTKKKLPNMILTGVSGIGKTSTIECIARELYGKNYDMYVLEINASDDKGAKTITDSIVSFCRSKISSQYVCNDVPYKLIILNDADILIERSQPQLSLLMDHFKEYARFVFTCNTSSCIIEAIQTKCVKLRFCRIDNDLVEKKLLHICRAEKIKFEENALKHLAVVSNGDLRSAINFLQMIYNKNDIVTLNAVNNLCDLPQQVIIKKMIHLAINKKLRESLDVLYELVEKGYSGSDITLGMMNTLKSDICADIPEKTKMKVMYHVSMGSHRISQGVDTMLQLASCIADIVNQI